MLAAALRAHVHLARDELEPAIRILTDLQPTAPLWRYTWEFHEALAAERIRLARALLATGDYERALHFASLFDQPGPVTYLAYLGPSLEIRARAAAALGRTQQEREFRDRLRHLGWETGEAPLLMKGPLLAIRP